jgi:hypothetical protein
MFSRHRRFEPEDKPADDSGKLDGATNVVPSFITVNGPIREARFVRKPDGTPDGGVHGLFVITGRTDAPGCKITQVLAVLIGDLADPGLAISDRVQGITEGVHACCLG